MLSFIAAYAGIGFLIAMVVLTMRSGRFFDIFRMEASREGIEVSDTVLLVLTTLIVAVAWPFLLAKWGR